MKLFVSIALMLSFCLISFAQEQQPPPKKKTLSMDMNDVKPAPKQEEKPKEESKETPKATTPSTQPTTNPSPSPTAPVDPEANWPPWAKVHKQLLVAYLESQLNGEDPTPYFYYGNSAVASTGSATPPVNMRGSYGYKVLSFEGDSDTCLWKISVQAPAGRSSTAGLWFAVVKLNAGGDAFKIYSMSRNNPYQR